jgi:MFS transporter, SHS family, lactate transporter
VALRRPCETNQHEGTTPTSKGEINIMPATIAFGSAVPWWNEPTKDQWYAYIAAWLGWTLAAFAFTVFLVLIVSIAQQFDEPLTWIALAGMLTLWMRLLGIGMGADWPAGVALAIETWPTRFRSLMSAILLNSWALGYPLSAVLCATIYDYIGGGGMLWFGVLPALVVVWIRIYVEEPWVWVENQRQQKAQGPYTMVPLLVIFRRNELRNTITACLWMAGGLVIYYLTFELFVTLMTGNLAMSPDTVSWLLVLITIATFFAAFGWGWLADKIRRYRPMILAAGIGLFVSSFYLMRTDYTMIAIAFALQGAIAGSMYFQIPAYMNERAPTEVRTSATAFCYQQGAKFVGLVAVVVSYFAVDRELGFALPMPATATNAIIV